MTIRLAPVPLTEQALRLVELAERFAPPMTSLATPAPTTSPRRGAARRQRLQALTPATVLQPYLSDLTLELEPADLPEGSVETLCLWLGAPGGPVDLAATVRFYLDCLDDQGWPVEVYSQFHFDSLHLSSRYPLTPGLSRVTLTPHAGYQPGCRLGSLGDAIARASIDVRKTRLAGVELLAYLALDVAACLRLLSPDQPALHLAGLVAGNDVRNGRLVPVLNVRELRTNFGLNHPSNRQTGRWALPTCQSTSDAIPVRW